MALSDLKLETIAKKYNAYSTNSYSTRIYSCLYAFPAMKGCMSISQRWTMDCLWRLNYFMLSQSIQILHV